MANWLDTLKALAPTVASATLGPLGGAAVAMIGSVLGIDSPTQEKIKNAFEAGNLTPDQVAEIKKLELDYQAKEKELGFKFAELEFKDRDSARGAAVQGGVMRELFWLSVILLLTTIGAELAVLFLGYPENVNEVIVGRVLGQLDAISLTVLAFWYGNTSASNRKTEIIANSPPISGK